MADFDDASAESSLPPGRHEPGAARHTGPTPIHTEDSLVADGHQDAPARHGSRRRRWVWVVIPIALVVVLAVALAPSILNWISISVEDEDRTIALDGDASPHVIVPAGWVLEQRPFAKETVLHTPDGAVAICFSTPEAGDAPLSERLAEEQGWSDATFSLEQTPSGTQVTHAIRLQPAESTDVADGITGAADAPASSESETPASDGASDANSDKSENPCGGLQVTMLAVVETGTNDAANSDRTDASNNAGQPVAVRVGTEGDIAPYLGEIADILAGVTT